MKYVAFDIGNVLMPVDLSPFEKAWRNNGLHYHYNYDQFLSNLQAAQDVGLTTINREVTLSGLISEVPGVMNDLVDAWDKIIHPEEKMMNLLDELAQDNFKIALLSNIGTNHCQLIREKWPHIFENKILHLSCEVGARKPTKLFFQSFLMDHPEFRGHLYVDDNETNLARGTEYGLVPYQFDLSKIADLDEAIEQLKDKIWDNQVDRS